VVGSLSQMVWYARTGRQRHLALLGALNGIAGLLHIATVALVPASAALILLRERSGWRRLGTALLVYAAALLLFLVIPVLAIGFGFLGLTTAAEILPWLTSSRHGYRVVVNALSIPRAAYGLARTFVFLEFFWAAPKWVIALKGAVFLAVAAWAIRHIRPVWGRLDPPARSVRRAVLLFVALQAALGAYFFGSDTERWVFIAPLLWLALADAVSLASASQQRLAALIVGAMFTVNLVQGIWPAATDRSTEARVRALAEILPGKAVVVITPGEDWLGYYHYFTGERLDRLDLLDVAMRTRDDHAAFYAEIERRIDRAREAAGTVLMIRVIDPSENYRVSAWQALAAFGYQPPQVREWFGRYRWDEMRLNDPAHTRVYRLRAPAPPAPPEHG
jgi:hypothetical protein